MTTVPPTDRAVVPSPRSAPTGWALAAARKALADRCHCGEEFAECRGCGAPRCARCEPVQSEDCLWRL